MNDNIIRAADSALADLRQYHHHDNFYARLEAIAEALQWSRSLWTSLQAIEDPLEAAPMLDPRTPEFIETPPDEADTVVIETPKAKGRAK